MTAAVRPAIEIAVFGLARLACCANRTRRGGDSRCKDPEDGIKMPDDFRLAANHLAVTALQAPNPSADADIDVMNSCVLKLSRAAYVVFEQWRRGWITLPDLMQLNPKSTKR
jgi:hypothetical protein